VCRLVLLAATVWTIAGLSVVPLLTGRLDLVGALLWPVLAWGLLRSSNAPVYAGIFMVTAELELLGTSLGNWVWAWQLPVLGIPAGNPPSVVAGGYCLVDGAVLRITALLSRLGSRIIPSDLATAS
jgi:hypothetical protein